MTDYEERPWDAAGQDAGDNDAEWYAWCGRHGWGELDPYSHRYWSRKQFRASLKAMPKTHPDRWKFEIGARWSPKGDTLPLIAGILLGVGVPIVSIPASVLTGIPLWAVAFPVSAGVWAAVLTARHRALST